MRQVASKKNHRTQLAILAIVISVFALSLGDAVIKATGATLPLWQMYVLRSGIALPVLLVIHLKRGPNRIESIRIESMLWVFIRSVLLVVMWLCYYVALPIMPLSLAAAAYYTAPIFIIILTAVGTRKVPSFFAFVAIILGFCGVIFILRPETTAFSLVSLLPVVAAFLYALAMVLTSVKCRSDDPIALVIALNIAFVVGGCILGLWSGAENSFVFGAWVPINITLLAVVVILAVTSIVGSIGAAIAYQDGPPATIAAFDYTYLVFSLIWGLLFFSEMPEWVALIGIVLIFLAGILSLYSSSDTN